MSMDTIPLWILWASSTVLVVVAIELGYHLGRYSHRRSEEEKESPVSAIAGSALALLAFMLAFAFGIVANRYDDRKALVREEANAIRSAWLLTDLLPQKSDGAEARRLLREYLEKRLTLAQSQKLVREELEIALAESKRIQSRLWEMAVVNAPPGPMNSDMAALYCDALRTVIELSATRVAVSIQARVPGVIWFTLFGMMVLGMMSVGYQTGVAGSKRSNARVLLALSFSLVIALIAALDRPDSGVIRVSQQPQLDLLTDMDGGKVAK